jgi:hypothetical protein
MGIRAVAPGFEVLVAQPEAKDFGTPGRSSAVRGSSIDVDPNTRSTSRGGRMAGSGNFGADARFPSPLGKVDVL